MCNVYTHIHYIILCPYALIILLPYVSVFNRVFVYTRTRVPCMHFIVMLKRPERRTHNISITITTKKKKEKITRRVGYALLNGEIIIIIVHIGRGGVGACIMSIGIRTYIHIILL